LTYKTQEKHVICKYGKQMADGSKFSNMTACTSTISITIRYLMFLKEKTKKAKMFTYGKNIKAITRNGRLYTLMKQSQSNEEASTNSLASM